MVYFGIRQVLLGWIVLQFLHVDVPGARVDLAQAGTRQGKHRTLFFEIVRFECVTCLVAPPLSTYESKFQTTTKTSNPQLTRSCSRYNYDFNTVARK